MSQTQLSLQLRARFEDGEASPFKRQREHLAHLVVVVDNEHAAGVFGWGGVPGRSHYPLAVWEISAPPRRPGERLGTLRPWRRGTARRPRSAPEPDERSRTNCWPRFLAAIRTAAVGNHDLREPLLDLRARVWRTRYRPALAKPSGRFAAANPFRP